MTPFKVRLTFHGDLPFFLRSKRASAERRLNERTSVKDIIEACGVPHPEVDLILLTISRSISAVSLAPKRTSMSFRSIGKQLLFFRKIVCKSSKFEILSPTDTWENWCGTFASLELTSFTIVTAKIDNW